MIKKSVYKKLEILCQKEKGIIIFLQITSFLIQINNLQNLHPQNRFNLALFKTMNLHHLLKEDLLLNARPL